MSFDLTQTSTLQAVASADERILVEDLEKRVDAAVAEARAAPEVASAHQAHQAAAQRLGLLKKAERNLNNYARELGSKLALARQAGLDALIQSAAEDKPDFKGLSELAALESRSRQTTRAIERLVEHLLPAAHVHALREESHATLALSRAIEKQTQERAEKLLGALRDAVSEEVVLPVDLSKGVSGALLAQAAEYKNRAVQLAENADQLEQIRK